MRLLVVDAALACANVALVEDDRVVAARFSAERTGLAGQLPVMLVEVLGEAGLRVEDCDGIAVTVGRGALPGSGRRWRLARGWRWLRGKRWCR